MYPTKDHLLNHENPVPLPSAFTGKERDEETGYGYFGARYMDHELMTMWLSVDPMSDKYPSMSPYNYCAWNPVKLVDPDGRECYIPPESEKYITNLMKKAYFRLNTCKDEDRESMAMEISSMECEIQKLRNSTQTYRITPSLSHIKGGEDEDCNGKIHYNTLTNEVEITFLPGLYGTLAHELKHAYQFEMGDLVFSNNGDGASQYGYDIFDEVEAFNRAWVFTGKRETSETLHERNAYKDLPMQSLGVNTLLPTLDGDIKKLKDYRSFINANLYYRDKGSTFHGATKVTK